MLVAIIGALIFYLDASYKNLIGQEESIKAAYENMQGVEDIRDIEGTPNPFPLIHAARLKNHRLRMYRHDLRTFPTNCLAWWLDFPKIDLEKYSAVSGAIETQKTFESQRVETLKPPLKK